MILLEKNNTNIRPHEWMNMLEHVLVGTRSGSYELLLNLYFIFVISDIFRYVFWYSMDGRFCGEFVQDRELNLKEARILAPAEMKRCFRGHGAKVNRLGSGDVGCFCCQSS